MFGRNGRPDLSFKIPASHVRKSGLVLLKRVGRSTLAAYNRMDVLINDSVARCAGNLPESIAVFE